MTKTQRIVHTAEQKLDDSSHLFRRTVSCRFDKGVLRLEGKVPTFHLKQIAQSILQDIDGVQLVENRLMVVNPNGISSEPMYA